MSVVHQPSTSTLANTNYSVTYNGANLTVTQRPITVTASSASKVYGNADPVLGYQVTSGSLVNSDALSGSVHRAAGETVGTYAVDATGLSNGNYSISYAGGTLTVTPRPLTLTADSASKVYGSSDPVLGYRVTGGSLVGFAKIAFACGFPDHVRGSRAMELKQLYTAAEHNKHAICYSSELRRRAKPDKCPHDFDVNMNRLFAS